MKTSMADGAPERLVAQIGEALFGQPRLNLMELAEKVRGMQEVHGDVRAQFDVWSPWLTEKDAQGNYSGLQATWAWQAWQAALAARHRVGQEPVAVVGHDLTLHWTGKGSIAPLMRRHGIGPGSPLYAAPPAQSVDLAENMLSVLIEEGVLSRNDRVFQKLRAQIGSQAAGNG